MKILEPKHRKKHKVLKKHDYKVLKHRKSIRTPESTTKMKKTKSKKSTTRRRLENQDQNLDKMRKFWSKYKITENKNPPEIKNAKTSVESLPILTEDGITSKESYLSESHASLMTSARSKIESESNQLAAPSNPVGE